MSLHALLTKRRRSILDDWFGRIMEEYGDSSRSFFSREKDRFRNPMGSTIAEGIEAVFDALLAGSDRAELGILLDGIVRLRAVQELSPAEAVAFVFDLKPAVRKAIARELARDGLDAELAGFERRIDEAALAAFDAYMGCRERLMRIRADAVRNRTYTLLRRAGLVVPEPGTDASPPE